MTKNHGGSVGQYGGFQHFTWMNRRTGKITGGNDVQPDNLIFGIEKDHTELFAIRLALGLNKLLNQRLRLLVINQLTLLEGNPPVLDQGYPKN